MTNKIPENWELKTLSEVGDIIGGGTPNTTKKEYWNGNILWVIPSEVTSLHSKYLYDTERKITELGLKNSSAKIIKPNSLIICTRATIGNCCINKNEVATNQGFKSIIPNENYDVVFLYYLISNNKQKLISKASGTTFLEISKSNLENLSFYFPPLDEQKRIASALSKIDAYLENTIKLIEEKELFKNGIAKKLLTCKEGENIPEARFKEFNDEWETVMLGDILSYEQPKDYIVKSEEYNNENKYPVLTAGKTFILGYTNEEFGIYDKLPVIIFDDFTTDAKYVDFPFKVKSSAIKILKSKYYNTKLIYELIKNIKFNARTHKRYYLSEYQYLKIKIPKSIKEQEDIGKFLSLLDAEIDNLKEQKEEIKKIKKGVMKKLMNGEVRL